MSAILQAVYGSDDNEVMGDVAVNQRILVVEDNAVMRAWIASVLEHSGYQVAVAENGEAGLEMFERRSASAHGYDLVITDHQMPGMAGLELVGRLHAHRTELPVILVSGTIPEDAYTMPLDAILQKPFSSEKLLEAVSRILQPTRSKISVTVNSVEH